MWNLVSGEDYSSFNRYMVECESILTAQQLSEILVLIDTWWNVNVYVLSVASTSLFVLIDTWWNVNILPLCVSSNVSVF